MGVDRDFTPAEIIHAKKAGIPADRPGLLGPYPRMLYKKAPLRLDDNKRAQNDYQGFPCDLFIAESAEHEAELVADGWALTPADAHGGSPAVTRPAPAERQPDARDAEIALLKAQLAEAKKPRVGRPPRLSLTGTEPEKVTEQA